MNEFGERRFWLACFFSVTTTIGFFFTDKFTGGEYIAAITAILGLYGVAAWRGGNNV